MYEEKMLLVTSPSAVLRVIHTLLFILQAEEQQEVLVAGDPERKSMEKVEEDGGITYHPNFIKYLVSVSAFRVRHMC